MRYLALLLLSSGLVLAGSSSLRAQSQYPILDRVAEKVIAKYRNSSCQQLAAERAHPDQQHQEMEQRVVRLLHEDPQMREAFLNRVAPPIANKLFECGFIP
jgi:hypothetical protein